MLLLTPNMQRHNIRKQEGSSTQGTKVMYQDSSGGDVAEVAGAALGRFYDQYFDHQY
jgi:hypothetical protein